MNTDLLTYRQATIYDIPFVLEGLLEAEKSGGPHCANQIIFNYTFENYRDLLHDVLSTDVPGSEYSLDQYSICLLDDRPIGAVAAWVEGKGNQRSGMIKANLLNYYLGIDKWKQAQDDFLLLASVSNPRTPGTIQLEAGYISPEYRGRGIPVGMNRFAIDGLRREYPDINRVQVSCIIENEKSLRTLLKTGFREVARRASESPRLKELIPGSGFIQLELNLQP
jgi:hypothetical protein